jgi:hypothetical protein
MIDDEVACEAYSRYRRLLEGGWMEDAICCVHLRCPADSGPSASIVDDHDPP